jgi:hypothetical protein
MPGQSGHVFVSAVSVSAKKKWSNKVKLELMEISNLQIYCIFSLQTYIQQDTHRELPQPP